MDGNGAQFVKMFGQFVKSIGLDSGEGCRLKMIR